MRDKKNYKCESCEKSFTASGGLKYHMETLHEGHRNNKCYSCRKSFTSLHALKYHIMTVHEENVTKK